MKSVRSVVLVFVCVAVVALFIVYRSSTYKSGGHIPTLPYPSQAHAKDLCADVSSKCELQTFSRNQHREHDTIHQTLSGSPPMQHGAGSSSVHLDSAASYIITQTFGGQMTRAIKNMALQQCWAGAINNNTYVVEPFSAKSNLFHSPTFWEEVKEEHLHDAARFSDYYDLAHYNQQSQRENGVSVVTWEQFLHNAPRTAVIVMIPQRGCHLPQASADNQDSFILNYSNRACPFEKQFRVVVEGLQKLNFTFTNSICLQCDQLQRPLSLTELKTLIYGQQLVTNVTVLFTAWRNFAFINGWLQLPRHCYVSERSSSSNRLSPSRSILEHTRYYKKSILHSDKIITVMLRIERFLSVQFSGRLSTETVESCLNKTIEVHDELGQDPSLKGSKTFLTVDIGRFGSGIMQKSSLVTRIGGANSLASITEAVTRILNHFYNGKWTMEEYENTFVEATGGIEEKGYIAMLQRNIATRSNCLILMGGGSFQQVAAYQYIKNHPDVSTQCLHTVCVLESFRSSIASAHSQ